MDKGKKYILNSIWFVFIIGSAFHFVYDLTGKNFLIGLLVPINESIWEHTKLTTIPLLLYYFGITLFKNDIDKKRFLLSMILAIIFNIIFIPSAYYLFKGGLAIEGLVLDISIFLVSIILSSLLALHFYDRANRVLPNFLSIFISIIVLIAYIILTIVPPEVPIFEDPKTFTYGIENS